MRLVITIIIILLIPFILNLWNGYLKPAQSGKFKQLDCSQVSNSLNPYVNDIVYLAEHHGKKSDSSAVEGLSLIHI